MGLIPKMSKITINESGSRVEVNIKEKVNTGFARVIGINYLKVNKHAIAGKILTPVVVSKKKINAIFNYLLFQG